MKTLAEAWEVRTLRRAVLEVLEVRFDRVPDDVAAAVNRLEGVAALRRLHRRAVTVDSPEALIRLATRRRAPALKRAAKAAPTKE